MNHLLLPLSQDLSLLLNDSNDSMTSVPASPTADEPLSPLVFHAYDAIPEPVLLLSKTSFNIIYGNSPAKETLDYRTMREVPIYKVFPSWDVDADLAGKKVRSWGYTKKGMKKVFEVAVGVLGDVYVLTLHEKHDEAVVSRYYSEFQEIECVGKGGFGSVWRAKNRIDGQEYAIKKVKINVNMEKLKENEQHKLLREVKTFASLSNHPNVVRYYNAWMEDGDDAKKKTFVYIQMQLLLYNDLRSWMDSRTMVVRMDNMEILWQILSGLSHIHSNNMVHRDLKPENIFVDGHRVMLGDFGLATSPNDESQSREGTYLYTAPEILEHKRCTFKSDIYSFGVIFLELFTQFCTAMERAKVLNSVKENYLLAGQHVSKYPQELELMEACLGPDPEMRPSAGQLLETPMFIETILHTSPVVLVGSDPTHSIDSGVFSRRRSSVYSKESYGATPKHSALSSVLRPMREEGGGIAKSYSEMELDRSPVQARFSKSLNARRFDLDEDPRERISRLEQDVQLLNLKLQASQLREKQLEDELESLMERCSVSESKPIPIPKLFKRT